MKKFPKITQLYGLPSIEVCTDPECHDKNVVEILLPLGYGKDNIFLTKKQALRLSEQLAAYVKSLK